MPRNVIVVGPPRSGTSLTSDVFHRQGFHAGEGLRSGDDYNPFGYFEAEDLIAANVSLFEAVGFPHHNTWMFETIKPQQIAAIGQLPVQEEHRQLLARWNEHTPWMWKDPRFSITLRYWAQLIDWKNCGVVLTERSAEDVYWSWRRKGWCEGTPEARAATLERIDTHARTARKVVNELGLPHIRIEYSEYARCPETVAERISEFAGLKLTASDLNFHTELDHSSGRSRMAGHIRILLKRMPRGPLRMAARLLPQSIHAILLPERKFTPESHDAASPPDRAAG